MPRAKQLTVHVPDRPGVLGELGDALGAKKANILAFTAWTDAGQGTIRLIVDKPAAAKRALAAKGWQATEEDVVEVTLPHTPGSLGRMARKLGAAGVNIRYAYAGLAGSARKANVYAAVSDVKAAMKAVR
jgi:hypothetical protein